MRLSCGIAADLRGHLSGHSFLPHELLQFAQETLLKCLQILLREGSILDKLIEVLVHVDLHLRDLIRDFARILILSHGFSRKLVNLVFLQELLNEHFFEIALVSLRVQTFHFRLVFLWVERISEIQCLLRHFSVFDCLLIVFWKFK
jgi:hypothetical protein